MDRWPVPVPEDVRLLLRRMSGLDVRDNGYPWFADPHRLDGTDQWRFGPAGTFAILYESGSGDTAFADIDVDT